MTKYKRCVTTLLVAVAGHAIGKDMALRENVHDAAQDGAGAQR